MSCSVSCFEARCPWNHSRLIRDEDTALFDTSVGSCLAKNVNLEFPFLKTPNLSLPRTSGLCVIEPEGRRRPACTAFTIRRKCFPGVLDGYRSTGRRRANPPPAAGEPGPRKPGFPPFEPHHAECPTPSPRMAVGGAAKWSRQARVSSTFDTRLGSPARWVPTHMTSHETAKLEPHHRRRSEGTIRLKAITDPVDRADGYRVLVEATMPIGVEARRSRIDEWARDLAPSARLRRWARNHPMDRDEFAARYIEELKGARPHLAELRRRLRTQTVTLVVTDAESLTPGHARALGRLLATNRLHDSTTTPAAETRGRGATTSSPTGV